MSTCSWMALQMPTAVANASWRRAHAQRVSRATPIFTAYPASVGGRTGAWTYFHPALPRLDPLGLLDGVERRPEVRDDVLGMMVGPVLRRPAHPACKRDAPSLAALRRGRETLLIR